MSLIKEDVRTSISYNKTTNTYYVYEVTYFRDTITGKRTKKRRVVGKQDPVTHETIPTRKYRSQSEARGQEENLAVEELEARYDALAQDFQKQMQFDQDVKAQLTSALKRSSECIEKLISESTKELSAIKAVLSRFGAAN